MTLKDKTIGTKIRVWRGIKELTQENMANELNISKNSYMKIESNEVNITLERLEQIAKIFKISPLQLLALGEGHTVTGNTQSNENGTNILLSIGADNQIILELEKLKVQQKADKEHIEHLIEQNNSLKEIITLLKSQNKE
jgi:transcriptional regulator with XRE-family HTH domain